MIKVMALLIRISPAKWPLNIEKVMFILQLCRFPFASLSFLCSQCFYKFNFTIRHTKQMLRFAANIEIVNIKPELLFSTATDWEIEFQTFIIFRAFSLYQSPLGVFHSTILFSFIQFPRNCSIQFKICSQSFSRDILCVRPCQEETISMSHSTLTASNIKTWSQVKLLECSTLNTDKSIPFLTLH